MPATSVPRSTTSQTYLRLAAEQAAYAEHLAAVRAAEVRVGAVGWSWRIARRDPGGPWVTLPTELECFPAEGPEVHRRRIVLWLNEALGVKSVFLWPDREAADAGRIAYSVEVTG